MCVCVYVCVYCQHFFINTNFVEHNRHFLLRIFLLILSYCHIDFIIFGGN